MSDPFQGQQQALTSPPLPSPSLLVFKIFVVLYRKHIEHFHCFFCEFFSQLFARLHTHTHTPVCGNVCVCWVCLSQDIVALVENVFNLIAWHFLLLFRLVCFASLQFGTSFCSPWVIVSGMSVRCQQQDVTTSGRQDVRHVPQIANGNPSRAQAAEAGQRGVCSKCPGMPNCRQREIVSSTMWTPTTKRR